MKFLKSLFVVGLVFVTSTSMLAAGKPKSAKSGKPKPVPQAVAAKAAKPGPASIVDIVLKNDGEFDVLQAAVIRAGLVSALNGRNQLTVFAPVDAAFVRFLGVADESAAIAAIGAIESQEDLDALTEILLFHVIPGRRISTSVLAAPKYETVGGAWLTRDELLAAGVVGVDISASNGVIHVIGSVLNPN